MTTWPRPPALDPDVRGELEALDPEEAWALVGHAPLGRVAFVGDDGDVLVLPVNHIVEDGDVVFRTATGPLLDRLRRCRVTFQVDSIDPWHHTGWTVLVHGRTTVERTPCDHETPPVPWAGGPRRARVRLTPEHVTGRVLRAGSIEADPRPYL
jgi:hypothetical protein